MVSIFVEDNMFDMRPKVKQIVLLIDQQPCSKAVGNAIVFIEYHPQTFRTK